MSPRPSTESPRYGWRARLGMLLPSGNAAAEAQFNAMLPDGVSLHTTRLKLTGSTDAELLAMTESLEEGASLLADACVDLILFHCTAVTTWDADMDRALPERSPPPRSCRRPRMRIRLPTSARTENSIF